MQFFMTVAIITRGVPCVQCTSKDSETTLILLSVLSTVPLADLAALRDVFFDQRCKF